MLAAEIAAVGTTSVASFPRKRPSRQPFPAHPPRERVVVAGPASCDCCGGMRLARLGEDIEPSTSSMAARGSLLFEKSGQHQPLNRQAERYARDGAPLSLSTLADQVGACAAVLSPLFHRIEAHVLAAARLGGDDTTVPVLAKGKTDTGRIWTYVRDDRPFGGPEPAAALFYCSRDRGGAHPQAHLAGYAGLPPADARGGYGKLHEAGQDRRGFPRGACKAAVLRHG